MKKEIDDVEVELLHETDGAWLVTDGKHQVWIPKSMGQLDREDDGVYTLTAPVWFLKDKELI